MFEKADAPGSSLTLRYILALTAVALLSIGGQVLVQLSLARQRSDAHLVNIAGRQRMLSQKLTKSALAMLEEQNPAGPGGRINELRATLELWERSHLGLQVGDPTLQLPGENSHTVAVMFAGLEAPHQRMVAAVRAALANPTEAEQRESAKVLLDSEPTFLKGMNAIVFITHQIQGGDMKDVAPAKVPIANVTDHGYPGNAGEAGGAGTLNATAG